MFAKSGPAIIKGKSSPVISSPYHGHLCTPALLGIFFKTVRSLQELLAVALLKGPSFRWPNNEGPFSDMSVNMDKECRLCPLVLGREGEAGHLGNIHR